MQLGSCTANALCALANFRTPLFEPSRLFLYYSERAIEGSISTDSGAMISDGVRVLDTLGVCPETTWPYDIKRFADKPSDGCYVLAHKHMYTKSFNIDNTDID